MNLPFRERGGEEAKPIIPEMNGPAIQTTERSNIRWPRLILAFVLAVLILIGLVAGGRWAYHKVSHHSKTATTSPAPASTKPQSQPAPAPSNTPTTTPPQTTTPSSAAQQAPAASQPAPTANQQQTVNSNLSNTGPGDTLALFAFVAVVSTLGYHFVLRRSTEN
jgi:cytoskeletal protein RodZ